MLVHSNGEVEDFLRLNETGCRDCTRIHAALPYAMQGVASDDFYQSTADAKTLITTYCRLDWSVPFDTRIIKKFSSDLAKFVCIEDYLHAKVIWWEGWGVYIGSCNLTDRACFENHEVGIFFDQNEIHAQGLQCQLAVFFDALKRESIPASEDVISLLEKQNVTLGEYRAMRRQLSVEFSGSLHRLLSGATRKEK